MGSPVSPFFYRRMKALTPSLSPGLSATLDNVDPQPLPDVEDPYQAGPAETQLETLVANQPKPEDFKPSIGRRIVGALLSGLGTYGSGDIKTGLGMGQAVTEAPWEHAIKNYTFKAKNLGEVAAIEEKKLNRFRMQKSADEALDYRKSHDADVLEQKRQHDELMGTLRGNQRPIKITKWNPDKGINETMLLDPITHEEVGPTTEAPLTAPEVKLERDKAQAMQDLTEARKSLKEDPGISGPIEGRWNEWVARPLGLTSEKSNRVYNILKTYRAEKMHELFGSRVTGGELKLLGDALLDPNQADSVLLNNLDQAITKIQETRRTNPGTTGNAAPPPTTTPAPKRRFELRRG